MANGFGPLSLTTDGLNSLAKAQTGTQLKFTRIAVGDGILNGQNPVTLKHLLNEVKSLNISTLIVNGTGAATVGAVLSNSDIANGFYWREIGVFAQDPQLGEILYGYANANDGEIYVPDKNTSVFTAPCNIGLYVSNAQNVTAVIDSSLVYATKQDIADIKSGAITVGMAVKVANALTFSGGSTVSFDGSAPQTVKIPSKPDDVGAAPKSHISDASVHITQLACTKSGTVYALTGLTATAGIVSCVFKASATYAAGDRFLVMGMTFSIVTSGGEALRSGAFLSGDIVGVKLDIDNKILYIRQENAAQVGAFAAKGDYISDFNTALTPGVYSYTPSTSNGFFPQGYGEVYVATLDGKSFANSGVITQRAMDNYNNPVHRSKINEGGWMPWIMDNNSQMPVIDVSADTTVLSSQSGSVIVFGGSAAHTLTLPTDFVSGKTYQFDILNWSVDWTISAGTRIFLNPNGDGTNPTTITLKAGCSIRLLSDGYNWFKASSSASKADYASGTVPTTSAGLRNNVISSAAPSGGNDGDTWDQV